MSAVVECFRDIHGRAAGGWQSILAAMGIDVVPGRHTPCPGCGGHDRFRFDDRDGRGTWICSQGGGDLLAGDGFDLVRHVRACSAGEAREAVASVLGTQVPAARRCVAQVPAQRPVGQRFKALGMWSRADRSDAAVAGHPYAIRKGLAHAFGAGRLDGLLVIPIRAHGTGDVIAVQTIAADGGKRTYGAMTAQDGSPGYLVLGNEKAPQAPRFVCEGWATGIAIVFKALRGNAACAVSFGKGRLDAVAEQFQRDAPPGREVSIARDRP